MLVNVGICISCCLYGTSADWEDCFGSLGQRLASKVCNADAHIARNAAHVMATGREAFQDSGLAVRARSIIEPTTDVDPNPAVRPR